MRFSPRLPLCDGLILPRVKPGDQAQHEAIPKALMLSLSKHELAES